MAKLFKTPSAPAAPTEDPQVAALRNSEQQRAEADRTRSTQEQLQLETRLRNRRFGLRSLLGPLAGGNRLRSLLGSG